MLKFFGGNLFDTVVCHLKAGIIDYDVKVA
jgi:hypothetical protein